MLTLIYTHSYTNRSPSNSFSANFTKWSNALKQFLGNLPTNCLSVFDHFVRLTLKGLIELEKVGQVATNNIANWMNIAAV